MLTKEWITLPLGDVITFQRGYDLPGRLRNPGTVPIISSSGRGGNHNNSMVSGPGVITGRYGTIGKLFYIKEDYWPLNTTLFISNFHNNNPLFIFYLLQRIDFKSHSGKSGVPGVNRNDLHNEIITLPPTKAEQEAIAEALSDADGLIESLEQLIAKKRMIKQGAMQELLTGKKRLPGFSGEWEIKRLGDIATFFSGGTPSTARADYYTNEIAWITSGDLNQRTIDQVQGRISKEGLINSAAKMIEANTVLIALYGATAGVTAISKIRAAINQAVLAIVPQIANEYFIYFILSYYKERLISTYTQGGQPNLSSELIKSINIPLPKPKEQAAIATILSDMDTEISALETKLAKARQVKQGMMQELLTGRVRLV